MKIFTLCKPYLSRRKGSLTTYYIITIFVGLFAIVNPFLIGDFIDSLIEGGTMAVVLRFAAIFATLNILKTAFSYITMILYTKIQTRSAYDFSQDAIARVQKMSLSFVNKKDTDYLTQVINGDTNMLIIFCLSVVQNIVLNSIYFVVPLIILLILNVQVTLILIAFLIAYILIYMKFKKPLFNRSMALRVAQNAYFAKLLEQLKLTKFIKMHVLGEPFRKRLDSNFEDLFDKTMKNQKLGFAYSSLDAAITTAVQVVLFLLGGYLILNGNFTIGMFTIFSMYFNMMLSAAKYFFSFGKSYQDNLVSYNRLTEFLSNPTETQGATELATIDKIELKNLGFSYSNEENGKLIENLNLEFKKGSIYGVVGKNGAGKSTLIKLLLGMYIDERLGEIYFNGISSKAIDMSHLRKRHMGIAEQEVVVLNESIEYNVLGLDLESPSQKMLQSLRKYADDLNFLEILDKELSPSGEQGLEGNNPVNFSGGQKQKLSILRLMLKNPDVMIFDEPTSALDAQSTQQFAEYIQKIKRDKIIIIITHDSAISSLCDEVVMLK